MEFLKTLLELLDTQMARPGLYGWFHVLCFALSIALGVILCITLKKPTPKQVRTVLLVISVIVTILEIYKQINYTFTPSAGGIEADFQWYAFPWQFCSMPMYVGLLAGILPKGKVHDALCSFLATYSVFAGLCVMIYPGDVFTETAGINIQTMICHGTMLSIGIFLLGTGYVKAEHFTVLRALTVFAPAVGLAVIFNELAHYTGFTGGETFNMFFVSPHEAPSLPVYSIVQQYVPYPWCLIIYIAAFTLASYLVLLIAMAVIKTVNKIKDGEKSVPESLAEREYVKENNETVALAEEEDSCKELVKN